MQYFCQGDSREEPQKLFTMGRTDPTSAFCRAAQLIKSKINKKLPIHKEEIPRHYTTCYLSRNSFSPTRCSPKLCPPPPPTSAGSPVPLAVPLAMPACCVLLACCRCRLLALGLCSPLPVFCLAAPAACRCVLQGKETRELTHTAGLTKKTRLPPFCFCLMLLVPQHSRQSSLRTARMQPRASAPPAVP